MQEFRRLTPGQQQAFLDAVRRYVINPLLAGGQPQPDVFHKMSGFDIYEFRWDRSGRYRATCKMFVNDTGTVEIEWRHIGGHEIYQHP